jgi:hypothetical protein
MRKILISAVIILTTSSLQVNPAYAAVKCTSAPMSPSIEIHYPASGNEEDLSVNLVIDQAVNGDRADVIYYAESLYDQTTKTWTPWSAWNSVNQGIDGVGISDQLYSVPGKSREEIQAYSSNSCGKSKIVLSTSDGTGFPLDIIVPKVSYIYKGKNLKLVIGRSGIANGDVVEVSDGELMNRILTPLTCVFANGTGLIIGKSPGTCQVEFSTRVFQNILPSEPFVLSVNVFGLECIKGKKVITITKLATGGRATNCPSGYKETAKNSGSGTY